MIKNIGKHKVMHSDITKSNIDDLLGGKCVDYMYSDPPWGAGNLKYWQTINQRMTGAQQNEVDYLNFLNTIFDIASKKVKKHLFVEYGKKWHDEIISFATSYGFHHAGTIETLYKSGNKLLPMDLHFFTKTELILTDDYVNSVRHTHGYNTLQKTLFPIVKETETILDCCCGMGYTAQIAVDSGMTFYGNELNLTRLEKTIKRLEKSL